MDKPSSTPDMVGASALAEMGTCERRLCLAARYGPRLTEEVARRARHGSERHRHFYAEALSGPGAAPEAGERKPWCFVATMVYGPDAPNTVLLRRFRDHVLRPCRLGRALTRAYYRWAPALCDRSARSPGALLLARLAVDAAVVVARCLLVLRGRP